MTIVALRYHPPKKLHALDMELLKKNAKKQGDCGKKARRKLQILGKYHHRCVKCRSSKKLTIAHIVPLCELQDTLKPVRNAQAFDIENCHVLCVKCHTKEENAYRKRNALVV